MSDDYDYLFKCICVGDGGCGKTALVVRFSQGFFQEQYKLTIGVEFAVKTIELVNQKKVKLQIWDTGGQERFQYVRPMYYRGAMGAIILFDLTNRESFEHLAKWIEEVDANAGDVPMLLVGNKSDLVNERAVSHTEVIEFAREFQLYYIESSAKDGTGVGDVFAILSCLMIGTDVPDNYLRGTTVIDKKGQVLGGTQVPIETLSPQSSFFDTSNRQNSDSQKIEPVTLPKPTIFSHNDFNTTSESKPTPVTFNTVSKPQIFPASNEFSIPPVPKKKEFQNSIKEPEPDDFILPEVPVPTQIRNEQPSYSSSSVPSKDQIDASIPIIPKKAQNNASNVQGPITFDDLDDNIESSLQKIDSSTPPPLVFQQSDSVPKQTKPLLFDNEANNQPSKNLPWNKNNETKEPQIIVPAPIGQKKGSFLFRGATPIEPPQKFARKNGEKKPQIFQPLSQEPVPVPKNNSMSSDVLFSTKPKKAEEKSSGMNSFLGALSSKPEPSSGKTPSKSFKLFRRKSKETEKPSFLVPEIESVSKNKEIFNQTQKTFPFQEPAQVPIKGKKLKKEKKKNITICSTCGALINASYKFCNKCGSKL